LAVTAILQLLHPLLIIIAVETLFSAKLYGKVVGLLDSADGLLLMIETFELFDKLFDIEAVLPSHHSLEAIDVFAFDINLAGFKQFD
jgi:hypothetical protein